MIIKKFQAATETEGILMAKHEMGDAAVIMNIKTIKHRGIARLFKKDIVEVTAAIEERTHTTDKIPVKTINSIADEGKKPIMEVEKHNTAIEEKLDNLQNMLESKISGNITSSGDDTNDKKEPSKENSVNFKFMQLVYRQLLDNEVDEKYANQIIGEIETSIKKESNIDSLLAGIYQKIIRFWRQRRKRQSLFSLPDLQVLERQQPLQNWHHILNLRKNLKSGLSHVIHSE